MKKVDNQTSADMAKGSFASYFSGFVISVFLTLAAYIAVLDHINSKHERFPHRLLIITLIGLAISQLFVQLIFFLHLGKESKPRWNLAVFAFSMMMVGIIVIGTLWIMDNLDYHMMPPQNDIELINDEGIYR